MKFSEIISEDRRLKSKMGKTDYKVVLLSNIVIPQFPAILGYELRSRGINPEIVIEDYDNILQGAQKSKSADCVIVFWEAVNVVEGLQYKSDLMSGKEVGDLTEKTKKDIEFCLDVLGDTSLVLFNRFSSIVFNYPYLERNNFDVFCDNLNGFLRDRQRKNMLLIDIDKVIARLSVQNSVDMRYYYLSKALYSVEFVKEYTEFISPAIISANGMAKKAFILDCDNTLWSGIVGEDGFDGIEMSWKTSKGIIFEEVQSIIAGFAKKGVVIGLCSKNNLDDVEKILLEHPDMVLKNEHIVAKKINWDPKTKNLMSIMKDINLGADSLVFMDDDDFEVNFVRGSIPGITVLQRPKELSEYPNFLRENTGFFFNLCRSQEDLKRIDDYKANAKREELKASFSDIEDYLRSLEIKVTIFKNEYSQFKRIAQLTQKTNQFNLTTKRYSESEIVRFMKNPDFEVFSINVEDKFLDSGIMGVAILEKSEKKIVIDTFLLSCRIIGRNIEFAFFDNIIRCLQASGQDVIEAQFYLTEKNKQFVFFYEKMNFDLVLANQNIKNYIMDISRYRFSNINYIEVKDGGKN